MLERFWKNIARSTIALVAISLGISGCSYATAQGRQQIAYAHYVKKYSHKRVKQQTKFKKVKMPFTPSSKPGITTGVNDGPQSISAGSGN